MTAGPIPASRPTRRSVPAGTVAQLVGDPKRQRALDHQWRDRPGGPAPGGQRPDGSAGGSIQAAIDARRGQRPDPGRAGHLQRVRDHVETGPAPGLGCRVHRHQRRQGIAAERLQVWRDKVEQLVTGGDRSAARPGGGLRRHRAGHFLHRRGCRRARAGQEQRQHEFRQPQPRRPYRRHNYRGADHRRRHRGQRLRRQPGDRQQRAHRTTAAFTAAASESATRADRSGQRRYLDADNDNIRIHHNRSPRTAATAAPAAACRCTPAPTATR